MIGLFRKFLNSRGGRLFFVVLIIPFVLWGVADVARNFGGGSSLATVGDQTVEPGEFQAAYRQQLGQVGRMMGSGEPTPAVRQRVAAQTLDGLVTQAALVSQVRRLGVAVPDEALKAAVFAMPVFRGQGGSFDRRQFDSVLQKNNLSEGRFLELMRTGLAQRQILDAVGAGTVAPGVLVGQVFAFQHESRTLEMVELPLSAAVEPPAPSDDEVRRFYEDDPGRYSAPAYRHVKMVVLTPDTVAKTITVPDADVEAYHAAHLAELDHPETRSVEVVVAPDEALAQRLAAQWSGGADWGVMQAAAAGAGASAVALDDVGRDALPGAELADAAFAAAPDVVTGPVKGAFGFQVFKVVRVTAAEEQSAGAVKAAVAQRVARDRAVDVMAVRAGQLEDVLAAGNGLDQVPADIGAALLGGTLDAQGNTAEGSPAPIPGTPALREAILRAAFLLAANAAPVLTEGPDGSYYAIVVDDETKAEPKPFAAVQEQVREDWLHDRRRRAQEAVAARLLAAVKGETSLADAAVVAGLRTERSPALMRSMEAPGVPAAVAQAAFGLAPQGATMIEVKAGAEVPEGFVVAQLVAVEAPPVASDAVGGQQLQTALNAALGQDMAAVYVSAVRDRAKPTVNRTMLDGLLR